MFGPDGFDAALIGVGTMAASQGREKILIYDVSKMIDILLMDNDGWSFADAQRFVEMNIINFFSGETGPCFMHPMGSLIPRENDIVH